MLNIFQHGDRPPFWILIFHHVTVIVVLSCCCVPNFIKIGSRIRPPDAHNCRMFNALLLGNGRCHGNATWRTCREHDGMRPPKLRPSRSIGKRVMAFRIFSNMAAVRHFLNFNIWSCDRHCGPNQSHRLERVVPTGPVTMFHCCWLV